MSLCVVDGKHCSCQPEDGCPCPGVEAQRRKIEELYDALQGVMEWIDNWDPNFIYDDDWPVTQRAIVDLLNTRKRTPDQSNGDL